MLWSVRSYLWIPQLINSCISRKTPNQMFLSVSGGHICAPQMDINMASPYKALQIWVKRFCEHLTYGLFHRPDSWLVYLSSSISQILNFLYWLVCIFIFDSMTVKTQNTVYGPWSVRSLVHDFSKKYNMGKMNGPMIYWLAFLLMTKFQLSLHGWKRDINVRWQVG